MIILLYLFYIIPMLYGLSVFIRIINNEYNNEYNNLSYNEIFLMFLFALFPFVNLLILIYDFKMFIFPKIISFVKK